jgi:hypothetical protein
VPISVTCTCGKALRVKDEIAGKKIRCPVCKQVLEVPVPEMDVEMEDDAADTQIREQPAPKVPARSKPRDDYDEEEDDEPPRRKKKRSKKKHELQKLRWSDVEERPRREHRPWIVISPAIVTGVLMMIGAVVWFAAGLAFGRIFFYPPVLFIFGIAAVVRGLMGHED